MGGKRIRHMASNVTRMAAVGRERKLRRLGTHDSGQLGGWDGFNS